MNKINVLDIETYNDNGIPVPYCLCYNIGKKVYSLYEGDRPVLELFFESLLVNNTLKTGELTFFAHNLNFDGYIILNHVRALGYKHDWFIRDMSLYWIKIYILDLEVLIRCSLKLIPISVKSLGKLIGSEKQVFPYNFAKKENLFYFGCIPEPIFFNSMADYTYFQKKYSMMDFKKVSLEYCLQDVMIVKAVLEAVEEISKGYSRAYFWTSFSFSALSYKIFSKKFDFTGICKRKNEEEWYTLWLRSYCGGRCEVFGNPEEGELVHYFDVPGMYAQAMKQDYPIEPSGFVYNDLDYKNMGFHTVKVKSDLNIPVLPYKHKGKLLFPNGIFIGTFWYEELELFIEKGGEILEYYSSFIYKKRGPIFKDFIEHFTSVKDKGGFFKVFGKSMINGSYGSFALKQNTNTTVLAFNEEELRFIENNMSVLKKVDKHRCVIVEIKEDEKHFKFSKTRKSKPLRSLDIASITASKGRIILYKGFDAVLKAGGVLYYCDTDSIFAGFKENKLGQSHDFVKWTNVYDQAVFMRPKEYMIKGENLKIKGISTEEGDFELIKKKFYSNDKIIFHNQLQFRKKGYELRQVYINKVIKWNTYDKRIWDKTKTKTTAIIVDEN